jgi:hypothetical protein
MKLRIEMDLDPRLWNFFDIQNLKAGIKVDKAKTLVFHVYAVKFLCFSVEAIWTSIE